MVDVVVVTGGGGVVQRLGADARALSIALETAQRLSYGMLRDIDPYGDTVFNRLQIAAFLSHWQTLVQDTGLADHSAARAVARMAEFVRDNPPSLPQVRRRLRNGSADRVPLSVTFAGMPAGPLPAQQFTGQERDALEHQDYFGARYYRPKTMSRYQKVLVARQSPENRCYVPDGECLVIDPVLPVNPRDGRKHRFVGFKHPELAARFGWVLDVAPFEIGDLLAEHTGDWLGGTELMRLLLESIARLPEGTPVAATFAERILPTKETYLSVHRVVLR